MVAARNSYCNGGGAIPDASCLIKCHVFKDNHLLIVRNWGLGELK